MNLNFFLEIIKNEPLATALLIFWLAFKILELQRDDF